MWQGVTDQVLKIFQWYVTNLLPFEINKTVHMSTQPAYQKTECETGSTNRELQHTCKTNESFSEKINWFTKKILWHKCKNMQKQLRFPCFPSNIPITFRHYVYNYTPLAELFHMQSLSY